MLEIDANMRMDTGMKLFSRIMIDSLCFAAGLLAASAAPSANLDGATGKVFNVNIEAQSFELLTETKYDPKTDIGKSRFTVFWNDSTEIVQEKEIQTFADVEGPVMAEFYGIDKENAKALAAGKPFQAQVAEVYVGFDSLEPSVEDQVSVIGWFTPQKKGGIHQGVIEIDGEKVPVSLHKRQWKIVYHKPL